MKVQQTKLRRQHRTRLGQKGKKPAVSNYGIIHLKGITHQVVFRRSTRRDHTRERLLKEPRNRRVDRPIENDARALQSNLLSKRRKNVLENRKGAYFATT